MSTTALQGLLDYLCGTLTPNNMRWVAEHLIECADSVEALSQKPYTIEEIHRMIAQSEHDSAEGKVYDFDDVMCEFEEEFSQKEELQVAEAV